MAWTIPWDLIGSNVSGDFGDLTIYTDRNFRKVPFPRSPPKEPPTARQIVQRDRFRQAVQTYLALPASEKDAYERLTLKASCSLTGLNLWIKVALTHQFAALVTIQRQTGITVQVPPSL